MTRRTALMLLAAVLLLAVVVVVLRPSAARDPAPSFVVAAWLPVWDERATDSLPAALEEAGASEVSPTWATVRADGGLTLTPPPDAALEQVEEAGAALLPVVQNFAGGEWQGEVLAAVLADPARAAAHRQALVETAVREHWDGVDLDYEALPATAGPTFVAFLQVLRDDLREHDLQLSVTLPARTAGSTTPSAYDYAAIGAIADQVRVMAYDHAWSGSPPGPIAPPRWVREVVRYAVAQIPADKVMLGVGTYGYDWIDSSGVDVEAADAEALARRMGIEPLWDDDAAAMTFDYEQHGRRHIVWYESAESIAVKQQIAADADLRGVAVWRLGGEDPEVWPTLGERAGADR